MWLCRTLRPFSTLNQIHGKVIATAAELETVLQTKPVQVAFSQLPKPPAQPMTAQQHWTLEKKISADTSAPEKTISPFSDQYSWTSAPDDEKTRFKDRAIEDMIRYKTEYDEYKKIEEIPVTIEQMFDIIAFSRNENRSPAKVPPNGYRLFYQRFSKSHSDPDLTIQKLSKQAAEAWKNLSQSERDQYNEEAQRLQSQLKKSQQNERPSKM